MTARRAPPLPRSPRGAPGGSAHFQEVLRKHSASAPRRWVRPLSLQPRSPGQDHDRPGSGGHSGAKWLPCPDPEGAFGCCVISLLVLGPSPTPLPCSAPLGSPNMLAPSSLPSAGPARTPGPPSGLFLACSITATAQDPAVLGWLPGGSLSQNVSQSRGSLSLPGGWAEIPRGAGRHAAPHIPAWLSITSPPASPSPELLPKPAPSQRPLLWVSAPAGHPAPLTSLPWLPWRPLLPPALPRTSACLMAASMLASVTAPSLVLRPWAPRTGSGEEGGRARPPHPSLGHAPPPQGRG